MSVQGFMEALLSQKLTLPLPEVFPFKADGEVSLFFLPSKLFKGLLGIIQQS